jgi:hypothetical protein
VDGQTPEVAKVLMAAVAGRRHHDGGLGVGAGVQPEPRERVHRVPAPGDGPRQDPGLTRVPFNVRMSARRPGHVGVLGRAGQAGPVSKLHTLAVTLGIAKAAGLVVLDEELVRSSRRRPSCWSATT